MTEILIAACALLAGAALGWTLANRRSASVAGELIAAQTRVASLEQEAIRTRADNERYVSQVKADHEELRAQFRALAAEALETQSKQFLATADERFTRANEANKVELERR